MDLNGGLSGKHENKESNTGSVLKVGGQTRSTAAPRTEVAVEQRSQQRVDQHCRQASPNRHSGLVGKLQGGPLSPVGLSHPQASSCLTTHPPPQKEGPHSLLMNVVGCC